MSWEWRLLVENCPGCGICADVCAERALLMTRDMAYPSPKPDKCVGCGLCVHECPFGAVGVTEISLNKTRAI